MTVKSVALITNFNIYDKANAAMRVAEELVQYDVRILIASVNKDKIFRMRRNRKEYTYLPLEEIYREADCIIVLGGDGTLLDAARRAAPLGKPLLGINMGRLGYMTELEISDLAQLAKLFSGEFTVDERTMLSVRILAQNDAVKAESFALNDAVISNGSVARIVDLELYENCELISTYRADGLIVATPTGSTAYSMSAGGPITDPHLPCFCITPVCPHSLSARPLLFRDDAVLDIKNICQREKMLYLTLDGRNNFEIYRGDRVRITRAPMLTRLIRFQSGGFYKKLQKKLNSYE
ncbi:MAG: NAD(+)/NADH kinase [Clostridia bacterium]|nr:NAD(+)/NADH kinase [Clostridia bacterium]